VCKQRPGSCRTPCIVTDWNVTCRKCKVNININKKIPTRNSKVSQWTVRGRGLVGYRLETSTAWSCVRMFLRVLHLFDGISQRMKKAPRSPIYSSILRRKPGVLSIIEIRGTSSRSRRTVDEMTTLLFRLPFVADNSAAFPSKSENAARYREFVRQCARTGRETAVNSHQREKSGHLLLESRLMYHRQERDRGEPRWYLKKWKYNADITASRARNTDAVPDFMTRAQVTRYAFWIGVHSESRVSRQSSYHRAELLSARVNAVRADIRRALWISATKR